jgi:hypothetical protein
MVEPKNIEFKDLTTKSELIEYYESISILFGECFGKSLDKLLWLWAYIDNPFGDPVVSIALMDGVIVGHYAVIPMDLENESEKMKGFLSMTTMVSSVCRGQRLFPILAERVYGKINEMGTPAVVFGFPNDNSASGFKKYLGWDINEDYRVVSFTPDKLDSVISLLKIDSLSNALTLNLNDKNVSNWRSDKPNQKWKYIDGVGLKEFGDSIDVMHLSSPEKLKKIKKAKTINMILPVTDDFIENTGCKISFPYRFGFKLFNTEEKPSIFVQMSLSDIF